jgi:glycyl-tRNA synthetase beta subunit
MDRFTTIVGEPTIQYYDDPTSAEKDPETAFINIPHIHPGRDKHSNQDVRFRRLLEATMQLTFVVAQQAMEVLILHASDEVKANRLKLCEEILANVEDLKKTSGPHK